MSLIPVWVSRMFRRNPSAHHLLVTPRIDAPQQRVLDLRERVALAAEDYVGAVEAHHGLEGVEQYGVEVPVGVDETQIAAPAPGQPDAQGCPLALVVGEYQVRELRVGPPATSSSSRSLPSVEPSETATTS